MPTESFDPKLAMHQLRTEIDRVIQITRSVKASLTAGQREIALVHTKLQEAKMWSGKVLEELGHELPAEFQDKYKGDENKHLVGENQ